MNNERKADDVAGMVERLREALDTIYPREELSIDDVLNACIALESLTARVAELEAERDALRGGTNIARQLASLQALDDGLWFKAETAPEAYLQSELRKLHAAVECAAIRQRAARKE